MLLPKYCSKRFAGYAAAAVAAECGYPTVAKIQPPCGLLLLLLLLIL